MPKTLILLGSCLDRLKDLPDGSVHCCVTSPPYWALRDYGTGTWEGGNDPACEHIKHAGDGHKSSTLGWTAGERAAGLSRTEDGKPVTKLDPENRAFTAKKTQFRKKCKHCGAKRTDKQIGMEGSPDDYTDALVAVFEEVRRVLHPTGTLWLNLGDSYATNTTAGDKTFGNPEFNKGRPSRSATKTAAKKVPLGLKQKDMVGIPWMVAFALRRAGWYLRSDCIWSKPNAMPESVNDRPAKSHEYVFLLAKSQRYYFDMLAVREKATTSSMKRISQPGFAAQTGGPKDYGNGTNPNMSARKTLENFAANPGRNMRTVWDIPTHAEPDQHFAMMAKRLAERCILAGTSEAGACAKCGAPWTRITKQVNPKAVTSGRHARQKQEQAHEGRLSLQRPTGMTMENLGVWETVGWQPSCSCDGAFVVVDEVETYQPTGPMPTPIPCVVIDPFGGAGTTALVASRHLRNAVICELNPKYAEIAKRRITKDSRLSNAVSIVGPGPVKLPL